MRSFLDIESELGLRKFLSSELGTLYFVPSSPGSPRVIVRYFDSKLKPKSIANFAHMLKFCQDWVAEFPLLSDLVRVEQPLEIGIDFISRNHHTYYTSTDSYVEEHNPVEAPPELEIMREIVLESMKSVGDEKVELIKKVMKRSLLEPTNKTYFNSSEMKFIVVEPKFLASEVESWAEA